jgi:glycosyltransferase involved in cell wall biosynthesis
MSQNILLEGHNLTLEAGTGIATYARVLGATLRQLGYTTDVLVSSPRAIDAKDPLLSEISVFDAEARLPPPLLLRAGLECRRVFGVPFGLKPSTLELTGAVVDTSGSKLAGFGKVHAAANMLDVTRFHFKRYGVPAQLRLPNTPALFHATCPVAIRVAGCPNITTIHDLIPLRLPSATLDEKKYFLNLVRDIARRADHIVTVSDHSKADIMALLGISEDRVTNTYQSVHIPAAYLSSPVDELARDLEYTFDLQLGDYFLFVGAIEPKKNLSRLIDAYGSSGSKRPLIIVGKPAWQFEADLKQIEDERFLVYTFADGRITPKRRVRNLPYLPLSHLVSLMRGARAVLFPSLYEGFGLPVLEAMLAGAPVLTSNVSSLPEVAGDAALLVDPHDLGSITDGIRSLDRDDDLCAELVRKGRLRADRFSPERYASTMSELYKKILG